MVSLCQFLGDLKMLRNRILLLFIISLFAVSCQEEAKTELDFEETYKNHQVDQRSGKDDSFIDVRTAGRGYVHSMFISVFGEDIASSSETNILNAKESFGEPCDIYENVVKDDGSLEDTQAQCAKIQNAMLKQSTPSSPVREGGRLKVCLEGVENDDTLGYAVTTKLKSGINSLPTPKDIRGAYALFYPGQAPAQEVMQKLLQISNNEYLPNKKKWKTMLFAICASPDWQVP
jgi:hypothetical protein